VIPRLENYGPKTTYPPEPAFLSPMKVRPTLTPNIEDYLERIHELIESKGYARVSDIATALRLTRPSVSLMVQRLSKLGFVSYEKYRGLTLTSKGRDIAIRIQSRHVILTEFFTLLGLERHVVARDVEGIEHHLSPESLEKLEHLVTSAQKHPHKLRALLK
jgi:Mn-dependent DtxR family transcriptional regulator